MNKLSKILWCISVLMQAGWITYTGWQYLPEELRLAWILWQIWLWIMVPILIGWWLREEKKNGSA